MGGYYNPFHVAVALGCNLINSGSVAVFTGRKDSATLIARDIVDAFERGLTLPQPNVFGDETEVNRVSNYVRQLLGDESNSYKACIRGILVHHGSIPNVLRMVIEHALQEHHFKFVICTSTLSQGVNLPIRYLIVTGNRQGEDKIKTRDFHNLMGRAGRAGKYTEGTVIFSDQRIYDLKNNWYENWRWRETKSLLNPNNSESCRSHILTLLQSEPENPSARESWRKNRDNVTSDINSYLLNALANIEGEEEVEELAIRLAKNTLAYKQASNEEQYYLVDAFKGIAKSILEEEPNVDKRKYYARAIVDIEKCKEIQIYLQSNIDNINNGASLVEIIWPVLYKNISMPRSINKEKLKQTFSMWINFSTFPQILEFLKDEKFGNRKATIEHIVNLCENVFGFNGSMLVSTCMELLNLIPTWNNENYDAWVHLQKSTKYGLNDALTIYVYEITIPDRTLSSTIAGMIRMTVDQIDKRNVKAVLIRDRERIINYVRSLYPSFFVKTIDRVI